MTTLLSVDGLESGYGKLGVLHGISMYCESNELVAVVGPNGAGKTTLMRAIFCTLPATKGTVRFDGKDITGVGSGRLSRLGMALVPQGRNTFPDLSVEDNLRVALTACHGRGSDASALKSIYADFPRLEERRRQFARTLSGGERQMLALSQALITKPTLLALDEPTTGLAPAIVDQLIAGIVAIRERGTTVIWVVEESPLQIVKNVDRVYLLQGGTMTAEVPASDLIENTSMQKMFFGMDHADHRSSATKTQQDEEIS